MLAFITEMWYGATSVCAVASVDSILLGSAKLPMGKGTGQSTQFL